MSVPARGGGGAGRGVRGGRGRVSAVALEAAAAPGPRQAVSDDDALLAFHSQRVAAAASRHAAAMQKIDAEVEAEFENK